MVPSLPPGVGILLAKFGASLSTSHYQLDYQLYYQLNVVHYYQLTS